MASHPGMLIAYDAGGGILATLDYLVVPMADGSLGLADFAGHEDAGGEATDWWVAGTGEAGIDAPAKGSKVWPEWLGQDVANFTVELEGPAGHKRIGALVHRTSGHRRERAAIEEAIAARVAAAGDRPADIRDLVGGPDRPLKLGQDGR